MLSPSPTQQPPAPTPAPEQKPEPKKIAATPIRGRPGQTPAALFVKSIFRPIFRILYHLIQWIRRHKLPSLLMLVFFVASIIVTNYLVTKNISSTSSADPLSRSIATGRANGLNDIKTWLDALRQGNLISMQNVEKRIPSAQRPASATYVLEFSEKSGGVTWKSLKLIGDSLAADKATEDVFVELDITDAQGANGIVIWHFAIIPSLDGAILSIDLVSFRQALQ
jgi:hypothetical protein